MDFPLFSDEGAGVVLALLNGDEDDQLQGLFILQEFLLLAGHEQIVRDDMTVILRKLHGMYDSSSEQLKNQIVKCFHLAIEASPIVGQLFLVVNVVQQVANRLDDCKDIETLEACVRLFELMAEVDEFSTGLADLAGIKCILRKIGMLSKIRQRSASEAVRRIIKAKAKEVFLEECPILFDLAESDDEKIQTNSATALCRLLRKVDKSCVKQEHIGKLINLTNKMQNGKVMHCLTKTLEALARDSRLANFMLPNKIDFERIFFKVEFHGDTLCIRRSALNLIIALLPDLDLPEPFWLRTNKTLKGSSAFAKEIQPLALRILREHAGPESLVLAIIGSTLKVQQFAPSRDFLSALTGMVMVPNYAPFVLLVARNSANARPFVDAGIVSLFSQVTVPENVQDWYQKALADLTSRFGKEDSNEKLSAMHFEHLTDLCEFLVRNPLTPWSFANSNLLPEALAFLEQRNSLEPEIMPGIDKLITLASEVLQFVPMSDPKDCLISPNQLVGKSISAKLTLPGNESVDGVEIGIDLDFSGVENWYNKRLGLTPERTMTVLSASNAKDIIVISQHTMTFTHRGLLNRMLEVPENRKCHFEINGHSFSVYDYLFQALATSSSTPEFLQTKSEIAIKDGDIPRAKLVVPLDLKDYIITALKLLVRLQKLLPEKKISLEPFAKEVFHQLSYPVLTIGFFSSASKIVYHFPTLFSVDLRQTVFRMIAFNLDHSISAMKRYFHNSDVIEKRVNAEKVTCKVRRDHVLEDGLKVLEYVGPGMLSIDVMFTGEEGIGRGPTQEFFYLMSQQFSLKSIGLWRNENHDDSVPYVFAKQGLFPAPNADPKLFFKLGLLAAKCLQMEMILHLHFNPAFIKLIMGEKVLLEEVDLALATSIRKAQAKDLDLMPFVLPGYDDILLKEGGDSLFVTEENLDEYKRLVEEKTVNLLDIAESFRTGLNLVFQYESLKILSPDEICTMLAGETVNISLQEWKENVDVGPGFTPESPQIMWLFDVITEMDDSTRCLFMKFLTGSRMLPLGGLKSLSPRLTVACKDVHVPDECLPSVATCTNYLKLPNYSSKAVLKQKLLLAIIEGQETFLLS